MNAVGIDVSSGKRMTAIMQPGKETMVEPFAVSHTGSEQIELARLIQSLCGETRIVMESVGGDLTPVAWMFHDADIYTSAVNAM